jgi:hypothetical protein
VVQLPQPLFGKVEENEVSSHGCYDAAGATNHHDLGQRLHSILAEALTGGDLGLTL